MKANEIQIGDWITMAGDPGKVTYINCDDGDRVGTTTQYWPQIVECYEPIPLTAEILEKNGWKLRNSYPTEYELIQEEYAHCYYDVKHKHCIIEIWGETTIDILLDCVHELQHALRLCGLNELADNFKLS